eukprot:scaffold34033_cov41-Phaeocystis_antarctica.AAC.1
MSQGRNTLGCHGSNHSNWSTLTPADLASSAAYPSHAKVGRRGLDRRLRYAIMAPHAPTTLPKRLHVPPTRAGVMPQKVLWTHCSRRCRGYH